MNMSHNLFLASRTYKSNSQQKNVSKSPTLSHPAKTPSHRQSFHFENGTNRSNVVKCWHIIKPFTASSFLLHTANCVPRGVWKTTIPGSVPSPGGNPSPNYIISPKFPATPTFVKWYATATNNKRTRLGRFRTSDTKIPSSCFSANARSSWFWG